MVHIMGTLSVLQTGLTLQPTDRTVASAAGLLVDKEVTHPFEWNFYLNAHVCI